jgi:hypothetical protein
MNTMWRRKFKAGGKEIGRANREEEKVVKT